ncbi:hypothetical protein T10_5089 [Trichinella papuae]|uniref:Uncharacterized protein n=1 Tax=Trichinella papuae TaxID=268474 RepID=A0A0V1MTM1_9BILA|nr:hypothetical protein T10_5089 [Trichinella papuae]
MCSVNRESAYWNPFLDFRLARYLLYGREEGMIDLPGRFTVPSKGKHGPHVYVEPLTGPMVYFRHCAYMVPSFVRPCNDAYIGCN